MEIKKLSTKQDNKSLRAAAKFVSQYRKAHLNQKQLSTLQNFNSEFLELKNTIKNNLFIASQDTDKVIANTIGWKYLNLPPTEFIPFKDCTLITSLFTLAAHKLIVFKHKLKKNNNIGLTSMTVTIFPTRIQTSDPKRPVIILYNRTFVIKTLTHINNARVNLTSLDLSTYTIADQHSLSHLKIFTNLKELYLPKNCLSQLPSQWSCLDKLKTLHAPYNKFTGLPTTLQHFSQLRTLNLAYCKLQHLSANIVKKLPRLRKLNLAGNNQLKEFPSSLLFLTALTSLNLRAIALQSLPSEITSLQKLKILSLSDNNLNSLPSGLFSLVKLQWLDADNNPCTAEKKPVKPWVGQSPWKNERFPDFRKPSALHKEFPDIFSSCANSSTQSFDSLYLPDYGEIQENSASSNEPQTLYYVPPANAYGIHKRISFKGLFY